MACSTRCCTGWRTTVGSSLAGWRWKTDASANTIQSKRTVSKPSRISANNGQRFLPSSAVYGKDNMFNLEQSVSEWRRQMQSVGLKNPDIVDELESHLREDLARRVQAGESEEQAFESAVQGVGQASLLKHEFAKLSGKKWAWLRKLKGIMAGAFDPVPSLSAFTPGARWTLELARQEAPRLNHGFIGTEHVLLGLLASEDGVVPNVFRKMGVDRDGVRRQIENWVSTFPPSKMPGRLPYTPRVEKSLRLAATEAKVSKHACVGAEHIFLGLLLEGDGVAGRVLRDFGLSPKTTRAEIMRQVARNRCGSMDEPLE